MNIQHQTVNVATRLGEVCFSHEAPRATRAVGEPPALTPAPSTESGCVETGRVVRSLTTWRRLREMCLGKVRAQGRGASALQSPGSMLGPGPLGRTGVSAGVSGLQRNQAKGYFQFPSGHKCIEVGQRYSVPSRILSKCERSRRT